MPFNYQPYPAYKDSGVEWLGEVPEHWSISRLKNLCSIKTGSKDTVDAIDDGVFPFFVRSQTVERINSIGFDGEAVLTAGDGVGVGKVFHYYNGKFDYHQRVYKFSHFKNVLGKYVFEYLRSNFYKVALDGNAKSTVDSLRLPQLQNFTFTFPSNDEQVTIINFLEQETSKIDLLIEKQQKLIELLKEKRQAVISHAVTKGLNPNAKMKDYRLDWVCKVVRGNSAFKRDELLSNGDYIALQYGKTYKVDEIDEHFNFFVNSEFYKPSQVVNFGDVILISTSETMEDLGHSCFYGRDDVGLIGGEQILLKPNADLILGKFLYYYSKSFSKNLRVYATGLKVFRFNTDDLKNVSLSLPNISDQSEIVNFLDAKTQKIDTLIDKSEQAIELLKERKTALISAAVTGKIDVRNMP